ncbi:MAG: DUF4215 domain-containing protein [Deltaproteobacteria bacterium]|nr:DUF4215 domain-containing protein [Deltaproteobacteria bacterium]
MKISKCRIIGIIYIIFTCFFFINCGSSSNKIDPNAVCGNNILEANEECDDGNLIDGDGCESTCLLLDSPVCGNSLVENNEECDDGNLIDNDGCNQDCNLTRIQQIAGGSTGRTCVLLNTGKVKCWGKNAFGKLGYGNMDNIGDDELPSSVGTVDIGAKVIQLAAGDFHTCALLETGEVTCWGDNTHGELGYGNIDNIGDDELPSSVGTVDIGAKVIQLAAGDLHTCALLETGEVYCWGRNTHGELGYGNMDNIGDDELPSSAGPVDIGGNVIQLTAGIFHTCALLETGEVYCWGDNTGGQLGYGNTDNIGDDELPSSAGPVDIGGNVIQLTAGAFNTCALLDTGKARCWGSNGYGELGYGNTDPIGDDESPSAAGDISIEGSITQIVGGYDYTCTLLDTGEVYCWGRNTNGELGYGNTNDISGNDQPDSGGKVNIGESVIQIASMRWHTCAILETGKLRCWGRNDGGQLGYGNTDNIGDDELPFTAGDVPVW